jgi:hypothetical protein
MSRPSSAALSIDGQASDHELPLSAIGHPYLSAMHRYWEARRGEREMPARADLHPQDMVPFLGNVFLIDVEHEPRRFRFRLIGTAVVDSYGKDLTGRYTDEVEPLLYREMIERHYNQTVDERRPTLHRISFSEHTGRAHDLVRLTLPLSDDGVTINMLVLCSVFGRDLRFLRDRLHAVKPGRLG